MEAKLSYCVQNEFLGAHGGGGMTALKQHEGKEKTLYTFTACQQGDHRPDRKCIRNQEIFHILVIRA